MTKRRYNLAIILLVIGLFSLFVKASYVNTIVIDHRYKDISLNSDSHEYIHLAKNIANLKGYARDSFYSRYLSLLRTPGYPLYYALFEYFGTAPVSVLWSQVLAGVCIPVFAALLTLMITKNLLATIIAGFLCSISTAGIFLTGEIMVDLLFAVFFIIGFLMLYYGIAHLKQMSILAAGFVFGLSSLIKPTTIIWPFYSIVVYCFLSKAHKANIKYVILILFVMIQTAIIGGWSLRNYYTERVFSLSTIGTQTLRHYLSVEVSEVGNRKNSTSTINSSIRREQKRLRKEVQLALSSGISIKKLHETQFDESFNILFSNLYITYICYRQNVLENISGSDIWTFYSAKLPKHSLLNNLLPRLISFNNYLAKFFFTLIIIFVCGSPWLPKFYKDELLDRHIYCSLALILTYLYFALISGITFWTGPRIVFPAEFALIILSVTIGHGLFHCLRLKLNKPKMQNI